MGLAQMLPDGSRSLQFLVYLSSAPRPRLSLANASRVGGIKAGRSDRRSPYPLTRGRAVTTAELNRTQHMDILSRILIHAHRDDPARVGSEQSGEDLRYVTGLDRAQWNEFRGLANSNHVVMRALGRLQRAAVALGDKELSERCGTSLAEERARIEHAVGILQLICNTLESSGCEVAVIKSLDHWPDLGSDLDLYTTADRRHVQEIMLQEFNASRVARSWGDRLANKWNFKVPGLPELVEIHVQFLGQTGEHARLARRVIERRTVKTVGEHQFYVPAPEERLVISTLQRVYRHFYFRLCDIIDVALLLRSEPVDFEELGKAADAAGIWPGVVTFLGLIRCYIESYGGSLVLPDEVMASPERAVIRLQLEGHFLRMSKLSAASLYAAQCLQAARHCDPRALVRLPLMPPLAVSALIAYHLTGNDKGIW